MTSTISPVGLIQLVCRFTFLPKKRNSARYISLANKIVPHLVVAGLAITLMAKRMEMIIFWAVSPQSDTRRLSYGGPTIEACFQALTILTNQGWRLIRADLITKRTAMPLPVEAFDGVSLTEPLLELCQEWEMILATDFRL